MLLVGIYARSAPKSLYFTLLSLSIFLLNLGFIFEIASSELTTAFMATQVQYFGGPFIAPFVLLFVLEYCGLNIKKRYVFALLIIPCIVCFMVLTWPLNGLYYGSVEFLTDGPIPRIVITTSPYYYVYMVYAAALPIAADVILLYYFFRGDKTFKKQSITIIVATILPLFAVVFVSILRVAGFDFDPTPVFLGITCPLFGYSFLRLGLYRVAPIAREQIVETMNDGFLIIDPHGGFVYANMAAKRILPRLSKASSGTKIKNIDEIAWICDSADERNNDFSVQQPDGAEKHYKLSETPITAAKKVIGRCIMFFDITQTKQLLDEVSMLAERDPLTGLINRRTFFNNGELLFGNLSRIGNASCMMMIDIDYFKKVNDNYGHPKGDEVLKAVAEMLSAHFRSTDLIARYGGEEFSAFLPYATVQNAVELAEQIRVLVQGLQFYADDTSFNITVSIGIAAIDPERHATLDLLLTDADAALYAAKNQGRNRIHVSGEQ